MAEGYIVKTVDHANDLLLSHVNRSRGSQRLRLRCMRISGKERQALDIDILSSTVRYL